MAALTLQTLFFSIIGGLVPALLWLYFWLKEDCHPEPKRLLFYTFLAGALAIPVALLLETSWQTLITNNGAAVETVNALLVTGFAFIEESAKLALVAAIIFWRREFDEPVDAMVYLMTAALGFAALENILYLIPEFSESFLVGITTGNLRFIGATLLHALSSGVLGFFIAHQFCNSRLRQVFGALLGLFLATILHTAFNVMMLNSVGESLRPILLLLGLTGVFLIFAFEHIKSVHQSCTTAHKCRGRYCAPAPQTATIIETARY